jgi:hypothetical protein
LHLVATFAIGRCDSTQKNRGVKVKGVNVVLIEGKLTDDLDALVTERLRVVVGPEHRVVL